MLFEGDTKVLSQLFRKKQLLETGDLTHTEIRPGILVLGGVIRGAYGGGQVSALELFELFRAFDVAVGISTGAPIAGYASAKQARLGTGIYSDECTRSEFLSYLRFLKFILLPPWLRDKKPIMDIDFLMKVFRGEISDKELNQEAAIHARTRLYFGVTCAISGQGHFKDAKTTGSDLVEVMGASCVAPGISNGIVMLDGMPCTDGAVSLTFPVRKFLNEFDVTDLLILANHPGERTGRSLFERTLLTKCFADFPEAVREAFAKRDEQFREELEFLRTQQKVRYGVIWSDKNLGRFARNPQKIRNAAAVAESHLYNLLLEAQKTVTALTM